MNKVIEGDTYIIGNKENLWKYFKNEIIRQLDDNTLDFEEMRYNVDDMLEVFDFIQDDEAIDPDTIIKVEQHVMGGFVYHIMKEVE